MSLTAEQCALLRTDVWFSQLPVPLVSALLSRARLKHLQDGEALFRRGEPADGLYAALDGALHITGVTREGKEAMLSMIEPPMWFGEIALFDRMPRTHDAVAVGAATVLFIPLAALDGLLAEQPIYWRHFGVLMAFKVRLAFIALEDLSLLQPPQRVARRLLWLAHCAPPDAQTGRNRLAIKQTQLALMTALSRQTVNQLLRSLEERGVIRLSYGLIDVLDMPALVHEASLSVSERQMLVRSAALALRSA